MMWILTRVVGLPQTQGCPLWGWIWGCLELGRTSTFSGDSSIHPPSPLPWARPHFMSSVGPLHCPCSFSILDPSGDGAGLISAGITCQGIANLCSSTTVWPSPRENHFSPCCRGCRVTPSVGLWWLWPQPGCLLEGAGLFWSPVRGSWVLRQRCSCACSAAGHPAVWPLGTRGCPGAPPNSGFGGALTGRCHQAWLRQHRHLVACHLVTCHLATGATCSRDTPRGRGGRTVPGWGCFCEAV